MQVGPAATLWRGHEAQTDAVFGMEWPKATPPPLMYSWPRSRTREPDDSRQGRFSEAALGNFLPEPATLKARGPIARVNGGGNRGQPISTRRTYTLDGWSRSAYTGKLREGGLLYGFPKVSMNQVRRPLRYLSGGQSGK